MAELLPATKNLILEYAKWQVSRRPIEGPATVHVDEVASKVAAFYEQIRTIVDWKEEHLMRRAAIIRKLKRRFLDLQLRNFENKDMAEALVMELIRGGYFPNDKIEESKINDVQKILAKYVFVLRNQDNKGEAGLKFYDRLLEIASCEIEETLAPSIKEMALIDYMFAQMKERIHVSEKIYQQHLLTPEQKDLQIYIAVQKALFKLDDPIISYNLIKYTFKNWGNPSDQELQELATNMHAMIADIEMNLIHPLAKKFYAICEKYDTAYLLLGDILSKDNFEKIQQEIYEPSLLEGHIKEVYAKRLEDLKGKIHRAAIYTTLSIFITKVLSLIILEVILAKVFGQHFELVILIADILIPTCLMAFLVITVKPPSKKNINVAVLEVMKICYQKETTDTYEIKLSRKRGVITRFILAFIYVLSTIFSFGVIFGVLDYLHFPMTSIIINMVFIALILFASTAVKKKSEELTIEQDSGGFLIFITDIVFLPITGMGRWMSNKWKRYNAVTAFFNALIDMPFSVFVEFLERWRYFIKEKKEEL